MWIKNLNDDAKFETFFLIITNLNRNMSETYRGSTIKKI